MLIKGPWLQPKINLVNFLAVPIQQKSPKGLDSSSKGKAKIGKIWETGIFANIYF